MTELFVFSTTTPPRVVILRVSNIPFHFCSNIPYHVSRVKKMFSEGTVPPMREVVYAGTTKLNGGILDKITNYYKFQNIFFTQFFKKFM